MKKIILSALFILHALLSVQSQDLSWFNRFEADFGDMRSVTEDKQGNFILTGHMFRSFTLSNNQILVQTSKNDMFVIKITASGSIVWAQSFAGSGNEEALTAAIGADNSIFILGCQSAGFQIGTDIIPASFPQFVLKLTPAGVPVWMKPVMGNSFINADYPQIGQNSCAIEIDPDGNIIIGSDYFLSFTLNGLSITSQGNSDVLISKYTSTGDLLWVNTFGTGATDDFHGLAIDSDKNIYISSGFGTNAIKYNGVAYKTASNGLFKFSSQGVLLANFTIDRNGVGISLDNTLKYSRYTNKIYFATCFNTNIFNNPYIRKSLGDIDIWLGVFDTSLNVVASTQIGGAGRELVFSLSVGPYGIYLSGTTSKISACQNYVLNANNNAYNLFVVAYDNDLSVSWIKEFDGTYFGNQMYTAVCSNSSLYVLFKFGQEISFDGQDLTNALYNEFVLASYSILESKKNRIDGTISNNNLGLCDKNNTKGIPNVLVNLSPGDIYKKTNASGQFTFTAYPGNYTVNQNIPPSVQQLIEPICPGYSSPVSISTADKQIDFIDKITDCYHLTVNIESIRRRRCYRNLTTITYANDGKQDVDNVQVKVIYAPYTIPLISTPAWSLQSDSMIVYNIGNVLAGESKKILISDSISCQTPSIMGMTQCTKAIITPKNTCTPINPAWDHSDISIEGACNTDGFVKFDVYNIGSGNMADSSSLLILNGSDSYRKNFKLQTNQHMEYLVPIVDNNIVRLEANENPNNPFKDKPSLTISRCSNATPNNAIKGYTLNGSVDNESEQTQISCHVVVDSYDPNDKIAFPKGETDLNLITANQEIEYLIRFQNTGTDTAYKVTVIDTLDRNLDLKTLEVVNSSHPLTWDIKGDISHYLVFTLNSIYLPPASKNAFQSNGFIKYKIYPKSDLADGIQINNNANIYFDYNFPVLTNTTSHTIKNKIPYSNNTGIISKLATTTTTGIADFNTSKALLLYPNPSSDNIYIDYLPEENMTLILYTSDARIAKTMQITNGSIVDISNLSDGLYLYKIIGTQSITGKLIIK